MRPGIKAVLIGAALALISIVIFRAVTVGPTVGSFLLAGIAFCLSVATIPTRAEREAQR